LCAGAGESDLQIHSTGPKRKRRSHQAERTTCTANTEAAERHVGGEAELRGAWPEAEVVEDEQHDGGLEEVVESAMRPIEDITASSKCSAAPTPLSPNR
jgi:hypothetical protein